MPKTKKCTKCNLPYHECQYTQAGKEPNCKCMSKRDCCKCQFSPTEELEVEPTDPWICPCEEKQCQSTWEILAEALLGKKIKDMNDGDDIDTYQELFHCRCHRVLIHLSAQECDECGEDMCKKCIQTNALPLGVSLGTDSEQEEQNVCKECFLAFMEKRCTVIKTRIKRYENEVQILSARCAELQEELHRSG